MSDIELKPCPFCDCEMEIETIGRDWWRIRPVDGHEDICPFGDSHEWDCSQQKPEWKGEHASDWNNRIVENRLSEENTQLKADKAELVDMLDFLVDNGSITDISIEQEVNSIIQKYKEQNNA